MKKKIKMHLLLMMKMLFIRVWKFTVVWELSEIFQFNFDVEEMIMRYDVEIPQNIVFQLVLRGIINHLLFVAFGTLKWDNMLFRLFFYRFPETEYTTPTITKHDMMVDRIYDKLNGHLQSNDQIAAEGRWSGKYGGFKIGN